MDTLLQLLNSKGNEVWTIHPDETVLDAIQKMAAKDVGSLVVIEDGKPVGIFTERHYARKVFLKGRHSPTTAIREIMSTHIVCVSPEQTIEECMAVMTDKRIRHLPVLDHGELVGIVSIGDLVKSRLADQEFIIEQLAHYIHG
ncbi:MAG: CBS domain-containing protein [Gammaproteobacteria bacterium]|jgi:CBS domain-containing protein|nr:CBS domain-containing protein [Gammaproteobacteria bacterium]